MQIVDHPSVQASGQAAQGVCGPLSVPGTTNEAGGESGTPGFTRRPLAGRQPRSLLAQGAGRPSYRDLHRQHYRPRSNRVPRWLQQVWAWL
jgi:hypothetical protein